MNVSLFLAELRKELVRIDEVILAIERLESAQPRKRGRPRGMHLVREGRPKVRSAHAKAGAQSAMQAGTAL